MRIRRSAALMALAIPAVLGCGGSAATPSPAAFELEGDWTYLGPGDGPHELAIGGSLMVYTDVEGAWSSKWSIETYDNAFHHFRAAFVSGSGTYLPTGARMSGTYDLKGTLLTVQLAEGVASYPPLQSPGACTGPSDGELVPDCRLYIKR